MLVDGAVGYSLACAYVSASGVVLGEGVGVVCMRRRLACGV